MSEFLRSLQDGITAAMTDVERERYTSQPHPQGALSYIAVKG